MYDKCYFCLDQLPKLKKESTASFFVNFGRNQGTKEPTYITVPCSASSHFWRCSLNVLVFVFVFVFVFVIVILFFSEVMSPHQIKSLKGHKSLRFLVEGVL